MSSTGPSMMSRSMIAPTIFVPMGGYGYGMGMGGMGYGFGNLISLAFIAIVVMAFLDNIKNMFGGDGIQLGVALGVANASPARPAPPLLEVEERSRSLASSTAPNP